MIGTAAMSGMLGLMSALQSANSTYGSSATGRSTGFAANTLEGFLPPAAVAAQARLNAMGFKTSPGATKNGQLAPDTLQSLLAEQSKNVHKKRHKSPLEELFAALDANADGKVSKSEFSEGLGSNGKVSLDDLFTKLDSNGDGSIEMKELHSRRHPSTAIGPEGKDTGATASKVINADGSSTTSITYADGSSVTMTRPQKAASQSYNAVEKLIESQAKIIAASAKSAFGLSV